MNRRLFTNIACLLLAGAMNAANAQSELPENDGLLLAEAATYSGNPGARGTASGSRLIGWASYRYNVPASAYQFSDSGNYTYTGSRGDNLTRPQKFDQSIHVISKNNSIVNDVRTLQTFDAADKVTTAISQTWDTVAGAWKNYVRYAYVYNASGMKIADTVQLWNTAGPQWDNYSVVLYTRNAGGKIQASNTLRWKTATSTYDSSGQTLYSYDASDNLTDSTVRVRLAGVLQNSVRNIYTYNAANFLTNTVSQAWTNNAWVNKSAKPVAVNAHGDADAIYYLTWLTAPGKWDTLSRNTYTYDAAYNQTIQVYQSYTKATASFTNVDQYLNTYNSYNQLHTMITKTWNAGGFWELQGNDYKTINYYEDFSPTGIRNIAAGGGKMNIWPVPAKDLLNVMVKWDEAQAYKGLILDMQGRICRQWSRSSQTEHTEQLNIDMLQAGTYSLVLSGEKGGLQKTIFTVIK